MKLTHHFCLMGFKLGRLSSNPSLYPHHSPTPPLLLPPKNQHTAGPKILANHRQPQSSHWTTSPPVHLCPVRKIWAHYAAQIWVIHRGYFVDMAKAFLKTHDTVFAYRPKMAARKYAGYNFSNMTWLSYGP